MGDLLAGGDGHLPADLVRHLGVQEFRAVQEARQEMGQEMDRTDDSPAPWTAASPGSCSCAGPTWPSGRSSPRAAWCRPRGLRLPVEQHLPVEVVVHHVIQADGRLGLLQLVGALLAVQVPLVGELGGERRQGSSGLGCISASFCRIATTLFFTAFFSHAS